jgi:hypothetical protein
MKNFVIFATRKIQQKGSDIVRIALMFQRRESSGTARENRMLWKASMPSPFDHSGRLF